eukprot:m.334747 g.334747  ORF g.334747 m.334747 type:complete len:287 (-) comp19787_c1_seq2:2236-3096(-)
MAARWALCVARWQPTVKELMCCGGVPLDVAQRLTALASPEDAKRSLAGFLMARAAAGLALGQDPAKVQLLRGRLGKPYAQALGRTYSSFNWSHAGTATVLAAEGWGRVGVDVMDLRRQPLVRCPDTFLRRMRRKLSRREQQFIAAATTPAARLNRFHRVWAVKEAVVKAEGTSVMHDLSGIDTVDVLRSTSACIETPTPANTIHQRRHRLHCTVLSLPPPLPSTLSSDHDSYSRALPLIVAVATEATPSMKPVVWLESPSQVLSSSLTMQIDPPSSQLLQMLGATA